MKNYIPIVVTIALALSGWIYTAGVQASEVTNNSYQILVVKDELKKHQDQHIINQKELGNKLDVIISEISKLAINQKGISVKLRYLNEDLKLIKRTLR